MAVAGIVGEVGGEAGRRCDPHEWSEGDVNRAVWHRIKAMHAPVGGAWDGVQRRNKGGKRLPLGGGWVRVCANENATASKGKDT